MSELFMDERVTSNSGLDIHIPQFNQEAFTGDVNWCYNENITSVATVCDFSQYASLPNYDMVSYSLITTGQVNAVVESDEYKNAKLDFQHKVGFIWGDLEHGGCFIYKDMNGLMHFGIVYGFAEYMDQGDKYYLYVAALASGSGASGFRTDELSSVVIGFADQAQFQTDYPSFTFQTASGFHPADVYDLHLTFEPSLVIEWNHSTTSDISHATGNCAWEGGLITQQPSLPLRMWNPVVSQTLYFTTPAVTYNYGSWDGNSKIDPGSNPSLRGGNTAPQNSNGDYPTKSDDTSPEAPTGNETDAINSGFVTLYTPTKEQIIAFNNFLFSDSITDNISAQLKKLIADPIDYLVYIAMVHFVPNKSSALIPIKFVGVRTGVSSKYVPSGSQIQVIDCGSITIAEGTDSARDYSPYTKATIYLPYVGYRELKIEEIMGPKKQPATLNVKYYVDLMTGSFTCHVIVDRPYRTMWSSYAEAEQWKGTIAMYEGNCFEMLPISSTDFRQFYSGILSMVGGAVGMAAGGAGGIAGGLASMGSAMMNMKTNVNRAGNVSSSFGFSTGNQEPFLILSRPFQAIPLDFGSYEGYPSNVTNNVSFFKGYLETDPETVWGTDISYEYENTVIRAFDNEIDEIKELFDKGVYVNV